MALRVCVILAACLLSAQAAQFQQQANPVRKVVQLLQSMQEKVKAEGEKEEDLYKKFMCYCKTGVGELEARVAAAGTKGPQLEADIKESEEKLAQTKTALKDAQKERTDAKAAIASATAIREKEAKAFAATKGELEGYISQIKAAVSALESGMAGSFLQTTTASTLRRLVGKSESVSDDDKETLLSFLSGKASYAPKSGEITGILKQMGDEMAKNLKAAEDAEAAAISDFDGLVAAKKKEIEALTVSIEEKLKAVGDLGMQIVQFKADFEDLAGSLLEDKKLLKDLKEGCATKDAEYEERVKTRNEELMALAETIKILNDDDALELFKKTLPAPGASLVQVGATRAEMRDRAVDILQKASSKAPRGVNFLVLALRGKKIGFEKVISMIDEMVSVLKKEQTDDDDKKEYCASQLDSAEDKKKEVERTLADTETAITSATEQIAALTEEIAETEASIKELDKSVKEATEIRKEENEEYKALMQADGAAKELLLFAKNRLNKFYNPKLYKPPAKEELSAQGAIARDMAFLQVKSTIEPPPETWDAYAKKTEENTGVISMIDLLVQDLDKEMTEAETEEKNAQSEYDKTIADAKVDRVGLSKSLKEKTATKADLTSDLETLKADKKSTSMELMATEKFIADLHAECDWLVKYYDVRKEARAGEIDALGKAKAVLSGADYSL
jgi:predicted  nucleic acid-binding Zn-ribbon protein/Tfp pilus assembly protein PilV